MDMDRLSQEDAERLEKGLEGAAAAPLGLSELLRRADADMDAEPMRTCEGMILSREERDRSVRELEELLDPDL